MLPFYTGGTGLAVGIAVALLIGGDSGGLAPWAGSASDVVAFGMSSALFGAAFAWLGERAGEEWLERHPETG